MQNRFPGRFVPGLLGLIAAISMGAVVACTKTGNSSAYGDDDYGYGSGSGTGTKSTTSPELKKAQALEEELNGLNVSFSQQDVFRAGRWERQLVVSMLQRWIDWGDLRDSDLDGMKRAGRKLGDFADQALRASTAKDVDAATRKEMELKATLSLQVRQFLAKRPEIHNLYLKEKTIDDYGISFEDDGRLLMSKAFWRPTALTAGTQKNLEEAIAALADYQRLASTAVSGLDADKYEIVKKVLARAATAKKALDYVTARASADTRKVLKLLATISDKGISIGTTADGWGDPHDKAKESDYAPTKAEPMVSHSDVKTGLSTATSFSADQIKNQDEALAAMREFLPLSTTVINAHRGTDLAKRFVIMLQAQREGVLIANKQILFRRAENEVIAELNNCDKLRFTFNHSSGADTARVSKPKVADLNAAEKRALVTALERLKTALELCKASFDKKQGVRYRYGTDGGLMDAEISLVRDAIAEYKR